MIVVSELLNDAIRTGFLFCMGIAMVRITWWSELARFTLSEVDRSCHEVLTVVTCGCDDMVSYNLGNG